VQLVRFQLTCVNLVTLFFQSAQQAIFTEPVCRLLESLLYGKGGRSLIPLDPHGSLPVAASRAAVMHLISRKTSLKPWSGRGLEGLHKIYAHLIYSPTRHLLCSDQPRDVGEGVGGSGAGGARPGLPAAPAARRGGGPLLRAHDEDLHHPAPARRARPPGHGVEGTPVPRSPRRPGAADRIRAPAAVTGLQRHI
jgi:hypothetical protein